jgi:uncharacterized protein (DUF924 family)
MPALQEMKNIFTEELEAVSSGSIKSWTDGFNGLAAVILMDQFSRLLL